MENLPEDVESNYYCYLSKAIRFGDYSLTNIQKEIRDGNIQASSVLQSIFTDSYFYRSVFGEMSIIISFINFKNGTMACMISTTDYPRTIRNLIEENKGDPKLAFQKKGEQLLDSWNRIELEKIPLGCKGTGRNSFGLNKQIGRLFLDVILKETCLNRVTCSFEQHC